MTAIAFSSAIGPVFIDCVISEKPTAELEITEIPVESGARITDHAVVMPKRVSLDIASSNAAASYNALVAFQESRVPFTLVTGLSVFPNMLIRRIEPERDATYSQVLRANVELQEVVIVETAYAADDTGGSDGGGGLSRGQPGGAKSTRAAPPAPSRSGDPTTADRAAGTVQSGDSRARTPTAVDRSALKSMVGNPLGGSP